MGTPYMDGRLSAARTDGIITQFYTSNAWIEGRAEDQLRHISRWHGVRHIAAFPDLHPGKFGPVGCAVLADRIYPHLIGNDIGCGMSVFQLDLPVRKLKLEKAARRIRVLGDPPATPMGERLEEAGLPGELFATALGTIGGGNHFCEVQRLSDAVPGCDLDKGVAYLLVHSGSRGLGEATLRSVPEAAIKGLEAGHDKAAEYVAGHNTAVRWARLNRRIIAERAAEAGLAEAQYNLAILTEAGFGVRKDPELARRWFQRAAAGGHEPARERLRQMAPQQATSDDADDVVAVPPEDLASSAVEGQAVQRAGDGGLIDSLNAR